MVIPKPASYTEDSVRRFLSLLHPLCLSHQQKSMLGLESFDSLTSGEGFRSKNEGRKDLGGGLFLAFSSGDLGFKNDILRFASILNWHC